jgi:hypothetical protein
MLIVFSITKRNCFTCVKPLRTALRARSLRLAESRLQSAALPLYVDFEPTTARNQNAAARFVQPAQPHTHACQGLGDRDDIARARRTRALKGFLELVVHARPYDVGCEMDSRVGRQRAER